MQLPSFKPTRPSGTSTACRSLRTCGSTQSRTHSAPKPLAGAIKQFIGRQHKVHAAASDAETDIDDASKLLESAAAPRDASQIADAEESLPSTSGRNDASPLSVGGVLESLDQEPSLFEKIRWAFTDAAAASPETRPTPMEIAADPLPEKNFGNLRGGEYPFMYDPVYGLPIVREVARYGELLRDIRQGEVSQVLWFFDPARADPYHMDGRCLVRYKDGRVKQSVVPLTDFRIPYAMEAHNVKGIKIPLEPRHVVEYAAFDDKDMHPLQRLSKQYLSYEEPSEAAKRRGPRIGPTEGEQLLTADQATKDEAVFLQQVSIDALASELQRMPDDQWAEYQGFSATRGDTNQADWEKALTRPPPRQIEGSWSDRIIISQDMQAFIYKYIPIVGPILGSAFVVGLYVTARLLRGDLTDRMKMMDEGQEKRRRTALKEARIAFLEEEVPALVAKGYDIDAIKKKMVEVNKKLGEKFEISDSELSSVVDACGQLLTEGVDLDTGDQASTAAERILAEEDAAAQRAAQDEVNSEGGGGQQSAADALQEMGKLNTARIRKAVDPKILEVKKRVRAARRSLKRESKVQLSDEIIFFDDIAGNEQAKIELMEVVDFFRKPEKFRSSGARAPKGVLLVGPPGNGKTLMARAVAGESGVAFISSSASEFIEMYMGLGAARVRDVFNTARKLSPCIIFIDELDAVGRARRTGTQGGNDERDNTVNQLLTELDGFSAESAGIVVMGATNRKDVLDSALTRPGRFDRSIEVRRPDYQGRLEGIKIHLREKPIAADIDYSHLAALTGGMSGAQLAGVCNTACFLASREGRTEVAQEDLVKAIDQAKYGKTFEAQRFVSPARRKRFAVMEAGIALTATLMPAIERVDFVTILPSVKSPIGRTVLQASVARYTTGVWTRKYLEQQLLVALAGRAAEEVTFGFDELSSLNQNRIMFARQIVHKMLNAGFSEHPDFKNIRTLGSNYLDPSIEPGRWTQFTITTDYNQSRSEWVDTDVEMEDRLNQAYKEVKELLLRNKACLDILIDTLFEQERLTGDEVRDIVEEHAFPEDLKLRETAKEVAFM